MSGLPGKGAWTGYVGDKEVLDEIARIEKKLFAG